MKKHILVIWAVVLCAVMLPLAGCLIKRETPETQRATYQAVLAEAKEENGERQKEKEDYLEGKRAERKRVRDAKWRREHYLAEVAIPEVAPGVYAVRDPFMCCPNCKRGVTRWTPRDAQGYPIGALRCSYCSERGEPHIWNFPPIEQQIGTTDDALAWVAQHGKIVDITSVEPDTTLEELDPTFYVRVEKSTE